MDSISGKTFLESKLLSHVDQPFTLEHLISVLFQITQMSSATPAPVIAATRAVAFLLKDHAANELADTIAKHITNNVTSKLVDHVIAAISPQVALVHTASQSLTTLLDDTTNLHKSIGRERTEKEESIKTAADRIEEAADALYESVETYQKALHTLTPSLDATQEKIDMLSTQMTKIPSQPPATMPSYSAAVTANLDPTIDRALGRAAIRARQILLDPKPDSSLFSANTPTSEIAKKLNDALDKARDESTPQGRIKAVSILKNGGLIVELESESLATWLNNPPGKTALESHLDIDVSFRYRSFPIVLEYLSIQLQIENEDFLRQIEHDNQLSPASLASIRWIKPAAKRSPQQTKAFALLHVSDIHTANDILRDGLCIANERVNVRKDKKEPLRCAKCQKFNHIAKNCTSAVDICGTCGNDHRTSSCNSYRTTRCVNCRSQQHTSWSRSCPEFAKRCQDMDDKYPENRMPYFPTENAWTQITRPPKPPKSVPSPRSVGRHAQGTKSVQLHQSTINFQQRHHHSASPQPPQDETIHSLITQSQPDLLPTHDSAPPSSFFNV